MKLHENDSMKIQIITIGLSKQQYLVDAENDYISRLKHYASVAVKSVRPPEHGKFTADQIMRREAGQIEKVMRPDSYKIVLDRQGRQFDSPAFSRFLGKIELSGKRYADFIIGGPYGLDQSLINHADLRLSFSKMTFTHDMMRLILLEQLYRAYTIMRGEKYHK